jgi:hypothetical protein
MMVASINVSSISPPPPAGKGLAQIEDQLHADIGVESHSYRRD